MPQAPRIHKSTGYRPATIDSTAAARRRYDAKRGEKPHQKLYNSASWKRLRLWKLARAPFCECWHCTETERKWVATVVDHIRPHQGDPALFFDPVNLQSMTTWCHNRKTAREDGGFSNKRATHSTQPTNTA